MVIGQMDAGKALAAAAAKGRTTEVQRILEECRVPPDTFNEFGKTALQVRTRSDLVHINPETKYVYPHASVCSTLSCEYEYACFVFSLRIVQCALRSLKKMFFFSPRNVYILQVQKNTTVKRFPNHIHCVK